MTDNHLPPDAPAPPPCAATPTRLGSGRTGLLLGSALLFVLVLVAYWPAMRGPFVWDDWLVIQQNPLVKGEFSLRSIWFQTDFPLTMVAFWLQSLAWGKNPVGYHVVNILLHGLSSVLLWRLLRRLKVPGAGLAGALFAVHPVCVASVAWISELKNTLSLPFYLLSFWWYVAAEETPAPAATETTPTGRVATDSSPKLTPSLAYVLSLGAFALALLSKTSTVMLPVVLLGWAWWRRGRVRWREVRRASPFFVLAVGFGLLTIWFQSYQILHGRPAQLEGLGGRLAGAGWAIWFYLGKALLPVGLNLIYPRWEISAASALSYVPLVLLVAVFGVCWNQRRGWGKHALFALGFFVVNLFPVLGILDLYFLEISRVSDHFQYLPLMGMVSGVAAGLSIGAAWFARKGSSERVAEAARSPGVGDSSPLSRTVFVLLVAGLAIATAVRAQRFGTAEGLWRDTLARNPDAWPAQNNLACLLAERNDLPQAIEHFESALRIHPNNPAAEVNLGQALALGGRFGEAEPHFRAALALKPNSFEAHRYYATALAGQGRTKEALAQLEAALQLQADIDTRLEYAMTLNRAGQTAEAIQQFRRVVALRPNLVEALNNLAWMLATGPDEKLRDGAEAVRLAEQSCRLTGEQQAVPLGTLAAAYAEAGRFADAEAAAKRAIALARASGNARFATINEQLLQLYQAGKPYHERR